MELEQAIDEREHALDQRGSELEERSLNGLKSSRKKWKHVLLGLNAFTLALGSNSN